LANAAIASSRVGISGAPVGLHRQPATCRNYYSSAPKTEGPQDESREPPSSTVDY